MAKQTVSHWEKDLLNLTKTASEIMPKSEFAQFDTKQT